MTEDTEPLGTGIFIGGREIPVEEINFEATTGDRLQPLDDEPGFYLSGLRDVSGTFSGLLDMNGDWPAPPSGPVQMYLYGPDPALPRWRHWFYRVREIVRGTPYPTVVLASGPAFMRLDTETEKDGEIVMTGTFTKAGTWTFNDEEVNP